MRFRDRLPGRRGQRVAAPGGRSDPRSGSERALERYRRLARRAPPERVQQAYAEAFAALAPEQRRLALQHLSRVLPYEEAAGGDDPHALARMATLADTRRAGTVEHAFAAGGGAGGAGAPLLSAFAIAFLDTPTAQALLADGADENV